MVARSLASFGNSASSASSSCDTRAFHWSRAVIVRVSRLANSARALSSSSCLSAIVRSAAPRSSASLRRRASRSANFAEYSSNSDCAAACRPVTSITWLCTRALWSSLDFSKSRCVAWASFNCNSRALKACSFSDKAPSVAVSFASSGFSLALLAASNAISTSLPSSAVFKLEVVAIMA